jgi:hypothetical protein
MAHLQDLRQIEIEVRQRVDNHLLKKPKP